MRPLLQPRHWARREATPPPLDPKTAWARLPKKLLFLDVETSGLGPWDRIVSIGAVRLTTTAPLDIATLHLIFNPRRRCNKRAIVAHGFDDRTLAAQDLFSDYAAAFARYIAWADLVVAHNAAFDLKFLNRELVKATLAPVAAPCACTMLEYRRLGAGSAALDAICRRLALPRGAVHSAVEDAWRTMQVYLWLRGCPYAIDFAALADPGPANLRAALPAAIAATPVVAPTTPAVKRRRGRPLGSWGKARREAEARAAPPNGAP